MTHHTCATCDWRAENPRGYLDCHFNPQPFRTNPAHWCAQHPLNQQAVCCTSKPQTSTEKKAAPKKTQAPVVEA